MPPPKNPPSPNLPLLSYQVLTAEDIIGLETLVSDAIARGWLPLGGVSVSGWQTAKTIGSAGDYSTSYSTELFYAQAMTK